MSHTNINLGVFQETKVMMGSYARELVGYQVAATKSLRLHRGDVTILYREAEHFTLEALCLVVSFQLVTVWYLWNVVRCYIAPNNASAI